MRQFSRRGEPSERFPRTRGDGPEPVTTRVSPARAGITLGEKLNLASGFPRTRGDGPSGRAQHRVSPARAGMDPGSRVTPARAGMDPQHCRVSPARAGMDRLVQRPTMLRFPPHARGWTLATNGRSVHGRFPPHARGWTRRVTCASPARSFPRTRGDGPLDPEVGRPGFPPHARGWTHVPMIGAPARAGMDQPVSPARAGMDRSHSIRWSTPVRFPRTRGDGPGIACVADPNRRFPPHARGWTRRS